ncbi:MAG: TIGR03746 family integrating conjugative element protein [Proteobacteria bacterium]|nr:TIGR03746 family integrating conjugative element protein [Pseudomonadota bacterium]
MNALGKNNQARQRLLAASDHIRSLRLVIIGLAVMVIALWWRSGILQETRRLYIPPDMTQGLVTDFDTVPAPTIYTFGLYIFQQLNRWKSDGEKDYPQQIFTLQGFLTPGCRAALEQDMNQKQRLGELRQRVRTMQEILGQAYSRQRVKIESTSSWMIWLDVNVVESIGGHEVKNVLLRYPLRVVRFDVDREINPWGLAIACDNAMRPQLLSDVLIEQPFVRPERAL